MEKPFVVCHMFVSMDGKIDGAFMGCEAAEPSRAEYARLRGEYACDAVVYGTVTMAQGFSDGLAGELPASTVQVSREDWAAPRDVDSFVVAVDPEGILGWDSGYMERAGRPRAHVIEALIERVSDDYLAYLRRAGVSYIIAGKEHLDCTLLLHRLNELFGIERVMLAGGGCLNGSFLQENLIDEVSVVMAPVADGNTSSVSIFERGDFLPRRTPAVFDLKEARKLAGGGLWLCYTFKK